MTMMSIVCDNAYHDRGHGVCSFCVQKRIDKAIADERERCAAIADKHSCGDCHDTICNEEIAKEIRNSSDNVALGRDGTRDSGKAATSSSDPATSAQRLDSSSEEGKKL